MDPIDKIVELRKEIFKIQYDHWTNNTLFSLKWWFMVATVIIMLAIWYKLSDKKRFNEISLAGFITAVLVFLFNTTGIEMTLWAYKAQIFGLVRTWSLFELLNISAFVMLLYQYFAEWKKYLIAVIVAGAIGSLIVQPFLVYFEIYKLVNWRNLYSFPIYIIIAVMVKFLTSKVMVIQKRSMKKGL
jgi:hypothetical protein